MKEIPGTEYISKNKSGYIVQKYINKNMHYFHFSVSLIECLMVRDLLEANFWDTELIHRKKSNSGEKYIYETKGGYELKKYINGELVHFGRYNSLEEAIYERDYLIKCKWDIEALCNAPIEKESWLNRFGKNQIHTPKKGRIDVRTWGVI